MDLYALKKNLKTTPSFVFDEKKIVENLNALVNLKKQSGCQVLYSIKALPLETVMRWAVEYLDGLSVSSLFEARLAKEVSGAKSTIHITTPGLRTSEFNEIDSLCTHISFNSLNQLERLQTADFKPSNLGLRINPKLSFASDKRFDPCRSYSKLGVEIDAITVLPEKINGLHFHTVFSNRDYRSLLATLDLIEDKFAEQLSQLKWLNFGGGYLFNQMTDHQPFITRVKRLKLDYSLDIIIEPGKAVVGNAGLLVTTVIDRFISEGKQILVLDTSVNHNPEVFEYQRNPELLEEDDNGEYLCCLVGSSCLAGDLFGDYCFSCIPEIGDRLVFLNTGAYSLIKANRFNGYNLPDVYVLDQNDNIVLLKQYSYQDYQQQWRHK